jgi:threonine/homoserine/homoserine lactone efflux protein
MIEIFIFSFLIALTGALTPGPVLTFTIYKSLQKRGYLAGFFIILGHATLEFLIICLLLLATSLIIAIFQIYIILILFGLIGGIFLVIFGFLVIRDTYKNPVVIDISTISKDDNKAFTSNNFLGGILVSLSNPFWTIWWVFIGLSFMINFNVSFNNPMSILLFFLGHELGDFVFYIPLSVFVYLGGRSINQKIYKYVLIGCGLFMIIFGIYLAINIFIFNPNI